MLLHRGPYRGVEVAVVDGDIVDSGAECLTGAEARLTVPQVCLDQAGRRVGKRRK